MLSALLIVGYIERKKQIPGAKPAIAVSDENKKCIECHSQQSNATTLVQQWKESQHAIKGVGCLECHGAQAGDIDAFEHYKHTIAPPSSRRKIARAATKKSSQSFSAAITRRAVKFSARWTTCSRKWWRAA